MPTRNRLTNSTDETEIAGLISGDNVFTIPYFQRAYKWKAERLRRFEKDILEIVDSEGDETHFLGAVIVHGRRSNPSDPDVYDVIDGQQRITTIVIYLCAIVKILCQEDEVDEAAGLFQKYLVLVISRGTSLLSNFKLHTSKDDRAQLNAVYEDLMADGKLQNKLVGFQLRLLPATGTDRGTLRTNYRRACQFLREQFEQNGVPRIREIAKALLDSMSVVQIIVSDPTNGPRIFDSLNSSQEPMTIGDLVRNEIFSKVAEEQPGTIESIDDTHWRPFYGRFQQGATNLFDSYFFPYGLIQDPNLRKSQVYASLKKAWHDIDHPVEIIRQLATYQDAFIDIATGSNRQNHSVSVHERFKSIFLSGAPTSTYPFLMQLSRAVQNRATDDATAIEVLKLVESFLVRRAICGHEPTGLHAVFKRLWNDIEGNLTQDRVGDLIREHRTVVWPNNEDVQRAIETRPLYGVGVTKYVLLQYDRSLGGDQPTDIPWIEHILPENPDREWFNAFTQAQHKELKDLLANLLPLSQQMNQSLSNGPYLAKREKYLNDSMFKSARRLAEENPDWTPDALKARSRVLAEWAIGRWGY